MGFLDFLKGGDPIAKHAARVANRRAQAPDRWDSIHALKGMRSEAAARALFVRFTYRTDPSISDKEEKDAAFEGIVAAGSAAVGPAKEFLAKADSIAWPVKVLERVSTPDDVVQTLLGLLSGMDTEYERDPERKIQVLAYLEQRPHPAVRGAVERFLADANETVRFHAVSVLLVQGSPDAALGELLAHALVREDSVRTRARILEGLAAAGAVVPPGVREQAVAVAGATGFTVDPKSGAVAKR